jgi:hypothetical protein
MPSALRTLFARILAHNSPSNPLDLWLMFKNDLSEDFMHVHDSVEISEKLAYADLIKKLIYEGKTLKDFPDLPQIQSIELTIDIDRHDEWRMDFKNW